MSISVGIRAHSLFRQFACHTLALAFAIGIQSCPTPPVTAAAATPETTPATEEPAKGTPWYTYEVLAVYPHDPEAFTQGLAWDFGTVYEGTGLYGRSSLRRVDLDSGIVVQQYNLDKAYFGEGIVAVKDRILQLTWTTHKGFVYNKETFEKTGEFSYTTQGWGITYDGRQLIMSDGTATLRFLHPTTFEVLGSMNVHEGGTPVTQLNELEYVHNEIFANIWKTDKIARIRPQTGEVTGWIDLSGLLTPEERANADVLNGIMYDLDKDRLFVTGKLWPKLFEIKLLPKK